MVNKGSSFANFVRFCPHTYPRTQQSVLPYRRQLKTHDWYESFETPFLIRVNMSKLLCSFRVDLKRIFYETSNFLLTLYFCEVLLVTVHVNRSMKNIKQ